MPAGTRLYQFPEWRLPTPFLQLQLSHLRWVLFLPHAQARRARCPPTAPSQYPPWILHDVNYGFELFLPLLASPALRPPGACQAWGVQPGRPWGEAGSQPASRSTDCNGLLSLLPSHPLPYPARPGCLLAPSLAILGVARGCGCFSWLCVFVVRVKKGKLRLQVGEVEGLGGACPQSRSAPPCHQVSFIACLCCELTCSVY